jgi:NAD-dependent deacetylase
MSKPFKGGNSPEGNPIVVFTGAGMSSESGLSTFREQGGLWERYAIEDVATPDAWRKDPELVTSFYNLRRAQLSKVEPNSAHKYIADLERECRLNVITQNVDDLHERAGSLNVLHLHGELMWARCEFHAEERYKLNNSNLSSADVAECGGRLRPDVVWFGEDVPNYTLAAKLFNKARAAVIIGTSLQVYPAANLVWELPPNAPLLLVDPAPNPLLGMRPVDHIQKKATQSVDDIADWLSSNSLC